MIWLDSMFIAFSLYTVIPVPQIDWEAGGMRYALAFLPTAGAAAALLSWIVCEIFVLLGMGDMARAACAAAAPIFFTGGIHLDGFMDTVDALSSHRGTEDKLTILKDSHIGAFAAAGCALYLLLYTAFSYDAGMKAMLIMIPGAALSRALCGLASLSIKPARKGGMLDTVVSASDRQLLIIILTAIGVGSALTMILMGHMRGLAAVLAALFSFALFIRMAVREFGGITGDLAGFFIQTAELAMLLCLTFH